VGNLSATPDTGRVTTVEDFYRTRYLYQLSREGEAALSVPLPAVEAVLVAGGLADGLRSAVESLSGKFRTSRPSRPVPLHVVMPRSPRPGPAGMRGSGGTRHAGGADDRRAAFRADLRYWHTAIVVPLYLHSSTRWANEPFCIDKWRVNELRACSRAISYRAALCGDQGSADTTACGR